MRITAKLSVAVAAALFGAVIAAGSAFAVGGSTMVADAPGQALQALGIGSPSAQQSAASAHLKLVASSIHGQVEEVIRAGVLPISGSTEALDSPSRPDEATHAGKHGSGNAGDSLRNPIPAVPAIPAVSGGTGRHTTPATPAVPADPGEIVNPSLRPIPHGVTSEK